MIALPKVFMMAGFCLKEKTKLVLRNADKASAEEISEIIADEFDVEVAANFRGMYICVNFLKILMIS